MRTIENIQQQLHEPDFAIRQQIGLLLPTISLILMTFLALLVAAWQFPIEEAPVVYAISLFVVVAIAISLGMARLQQQKDMLLMSEFQNAMLASAARIQSRFCLIFKRDGGLVYFDPGFQRLFPQATRQISTLDEMLQRNVFPRALEKELSDLLSAEKNGLIMIPLVTSDGANKYVINVDLLPKPKGYFLLRGREFVEKRSGTAEVQTLASPANVTANTLTSVQQWASQTNLPFFVLDKIGNYVCASASLLEKLNYSNIEGLPFHTLFYKVGLSNLHHPPQDDYSGDITLLHQSGTLIPAYMKFIALDSSGYIGFVSFSPPSPSL